MRRNMKKFFDKLSPMGCMIPFALGGLVFIVVMFIRLWNFSQGNIGLFILNMMLIPLAFVGGINVLRGFGAVLEMDEAKFGHKVTKGWRFNLYIAIYIGGYLALFYMIIKYI